MVKYKPRDFGKAIFDLAALYGPSDPSHVIIKSQKCSRSDSSSYEGKNCKIQVTQPKNGHF